METGIRSGPMGHLARMQTLPFPYHDNIGSADYKICISTFQINITLYTYASNDGWGAMMGTSKTGGRWNDETLQNINCLELMAVLYALKAFCRKEHTAHTWLYSDNTTAVNYNI